MDKSQKSGGNTTSLARTAGKPEDQHVVTFVVARLFAGARRAATWEMRAGATPVMVIALPVALTLLAGLAMGAIVPTPPCPGLSWPC